MKCPAIRSRHAASTILFGSIALLLASRGANAQLSYTTAGSAITQDFQTLPTGFNGSPVGTPASPGIFAFDDLTGINAANMVGWFGDASSANKYLTGPGTGGVTTGGFYGYTVIAGGDTALGMQAAGGSGTEIFGLELTNNTGAALTSFTISYNAETWHFGTATTARTLEFGYNTGGATLPTISAGGTITPASGTYVHDTALDYTIAGTGTAGAVDGHAAGNNTTKTATITGITWAANTTLWLTWDFSASTAQSPGLAIDNVSFSAIGGGVVASNVVWHPASNGIGAWDTATGNWTGGSPTANLYKTGDNATFDDTHSGTAGGTVTIQTGGVNPGSVTINTAGTYTFQNTGGDTNGISGTGNLTKTGTGTLILSSPNTYAGGTIVNGGVLKISNGNQLGAPGGPLSIDNATLSTTAAITAMNRSLTVGADGATLATNGNNLTNNGATTFNGALTIAGGGSLILNGAVTLGSTVTPVIPSGSSITLGQTTGSPVVTFGNGVVINGTLNIGVAGTPTTMRVNFDNPNSSSPGVAGPGAINVLSSGLVISNLSGAAGDTVTANIVLNSSDPTGTFFTKGDVTQAAYVPASFVTTIGATKGGGATINSVISGWSDLNVGNSATGGGSANITFGGQNTYHGATTLNQNNGGATLAANNVFPIGTDLIFGSLSGAAGNESLDLGGFNQQVASLSVGTGFTAGATFNITDGAVAPSTLTVSGTITPATSFSGIISEINGQISLVKAGTNTLVLSGGLVSDGAGSFFPSGNSYTGSTTIAGGTLTLDFSNANSPLSNILYFGGVTSSSVVNLGGGTLNLTGAPTLSNSQQINGLNVTPGGSTIFLNQNGASSLTLTLGAITQTTGGTVNFSVIPQVAGVIATTTNSNVNGILGTWATVGSGTTLAYATQTGVNSQIGAFSGTPAANGANLTDTAGTANYDLSAAGGAVPATVSANTIRYRGAAGATAPGATSFSANGLMNAGTGLWTISGNAITIGANKELDIVSNTQGITISSAIKNNGGGASSITASGSGIVTLSGANTYSGGTYINGGIVSLGVAQNGTTSGPFGASGAISFGGGTLRYSTFNTTDYSSRFSASANQQVSVDTNGQNVSFATGLTSSGGSFVKQGAGVLTLAGTNTYSGGTTVQGGTLLAMGSIAGNTTVQSGGTLGGLGSAGGVEVQSGGKLAPGSTTVGSTLGTLAAANFTWDGGGVLAFELSNTGNTSDRLSLSTGVLREGAAGQYVFDFLGGGLAGQTYSLITFGSTNFASASQFTATDLGPGLSGTFTLTNNELDVKVAVVPEPSALAGLVWGAAVLLGARRFRRRNPVI